jgi:gamma-glutamyltranspeptidase/glutathione hydrolase
MPQTPAFLTTSLALAVAASAQAQTAGLDRPIGGSFATRSPVYATQAMAATSHPLATQIALETMRRGGTAVDAAIAANAALGLMEPTGCGIGGDLFALVWNPADKKLHGYNGSGASPAKLTLELLAERKLGSVPRRGPLPVTVPGCVDGWFALHERFGKLPMRDVLQPAISSAREGFPMTPVIADAWKASVAIFSTTTNGASDYPSFVQQFTLAGAAPQAGEIWKNPQLADSYTLLATQGRDGFYKGRIAEGIASFLQSQGGVMEASDLAAHKGEWVQPISTNYRGYDVWQLPPNGQGLAALQILNVLEGFDLRSMGFASADYVHTFVEAKKLAFEDRARLYADPKSFAAPLDQLLSNDYAAQRRARITQRAAQQVPAGIDTNAQPLAGPDTVYLTVADAQGMMVSLIQSNYRGMGSGMVPSYDAGTFGFMLQNRGEQFATLPNHPNVLAGSKRPFHTIIPGFVTKDGEAWLSFGVMGGAMQPQGHAQIIINLIDFRMNLQEAGDAPRIHHDGSTEPQANVQPMTTGGMLNLESGFGPIIERDLAARGHTLQFASTPTFGGYQAIMREKGVYIGATESRKDGIAAGY